MALGNTNDNKLHSGTLGLLKVIFFTVAWEEVIEKIFKVLIIMYKVMNSVI